MRAVGVDGCRGGWVAVVLEDGRWAAATVAASLAEIVATCGGAAAIGVDMPLGLAQRGWRLADQLAAARLGPHRSRVFMVPPRAAWDAATHSEGVAVCRGLTDPPAGFSRQAWQLREKLLEADRIYRARSHPLFEVHPELSFAALAGGTPVVPGKKTWNGQMRRRSLLAAAGIHVPDDLAGAGGVPADDILDAAAAAWSAGRIAAGQAVTLPDPPQLTPDGLVMAIWY